ncbi:hypothetical protein [Streptomyces antibioticus]|uniref:hypothetical protein n=1 Tax=Streptomyces antibioticus TaxID=1890 RepID=UPI003410AF65
MLSIAAYGGEREREESRLGGADDPTVPELLVGFLVAGAVGVAVPALIVLPVLGAGIWLTHLLRRPKSRR